MDFESIFSVRVTEDISAESSYHVDGGKQYPPGLDTKSCHSLFVTCLAIETYYNTSKPSTSTTNCEAIRDESILTHESLPILKAIIKGLEDGGF